MAHDNIILLTISYSYIHVCYYNIPYTIVLNKYWLPYAVRVMNAHEFRWQKAKLSCPARDRAQICNGNSGLVHDVLTQLQNQYQPIDLCSPQRQLWRVLFAHHGNTKKKISDGEFHIERNSTQKRKNASWNCGLKAEIFRLCSLFVCRNASAQPRQNIHV